MPNWSRENVSGIEKLVVYINVDKEPEMAEWLKAIPYGKASEKIREAIRFYLEQANLQSASEKIKKRGDKKRHKKKKA